MSEARSEERAAAEEPAAPGAEHSSDGEVVSGEVVEEAPASEAPAEDEAPAPDAGADAAAPAEQDEAERAAEDVEADINALLADTRRERDEYLELAQRTRADFENFRKRAASEASAARVRGRTELASDLIGVIDSLERALEAASVDAVAAASGEAETDGPLEQGIVLTYRELTAVLQRAGVEAFDPSGEPFDPAWHEALQKRSEEGAASGTVLDVLQKGYRMDGQLIRPARVVVNE